MRKIICKFLRLRLIIVINNHYRHKIILKATYNFMSYMQYAIFRGLIGSVLHITPAVPAALYPADTRRHASGRSGWLAILCEA